jgi:hypothetical protein
MFRVVCRDYFQDADSEDKTYASGLASEKEAQQAKEQADSKPTIIYSEIQKEKK